MDKAMNKRLRKSGNENGTAIIVALTFLSVLAIMSSVFVSNLVSSSNLEASLETGTRSFYIAEAGINHAVWKLSQHGDKYEGESDVSFADGEFDIAIEDYPGNQNRKIVISRARLDDYPGKHTVSGIKAIVSLQRSEEGRFKVNAETWENFSPP
jgi:hypothetical protein